MSLSNITSAFKSCGIYPFNPNAILKDRLTASTPTQPSILPASNSISSTSSSTISTPPTSVLATPLQKSKPPTTPISVESLIDNSSPQSVNVSTTALDGSSHNQSSSLLLSPESSTANSTPATPTPSTCSCSHDAVMNHPLVKTGLIPARLADVLYAPNRENVQSKTRVIIKERVLTSDEWREAISKKEEEVEAKRAAAEERKRKTEERKRKLLVKVPFPAKSKRVAKPLSAIPAACNIPLNTTEVDNYDPDFTITSVTTTTTVDLETAVPQRRSSRQIKPKRFLDDTSDEGSDEDSDQDLQVGTDLCLICHREDAPRQKKSKWAECDLCGLWSHTKCAGIGKENAAEFIEYLCADCRK